MADDRIPPRHPLDADREHSRHRRRQAFRDRRDRERHAEDQHVENRREAAHILDNENRRDHQDGDDHDHDPQQLADPVKLRLQRRRLVRRFFEQPGDAPHLGLHSGRRDHAASAPVGRRRGTEDHVAAVANALLVMDGDDVLRDRQTFAGQRRLRRLQGDRLDQARVGWNRVAFSDQDDVAGDQLGCRDALPRAITNDLGLGRRHPAQGSYRFFCARLLNEAHQRVEQHDREDRDRLIGQPRVALIQPQACRYQRRDQQHNHEHVGELSEKSSPSGNAGCRRQLVPAISFESCPRLRLAQAGLRIRLEGGQHVVDGVPIGRHLAQRRRHSSASTEVAEVRAARRCGERSSRDRARCAGARLALGAGVDGGGRRT